MGTKRTPKTTTVSSKKTIVVEQVIKEKNQTEKVDQQEKEPILPHVQSNETQEVIHLDRLPFQDQLNLIFSTFPPMRKETIKLRSLDVIPDVVMPVPVNEVQEGIHIANPKSD